MDNAPVLHQLQLPLLRTFLEKYWQEQGNTSKGQCLRTTGFLHKLLGGKARGGWPKENERLLHCGFHDGSAWQFHYWLEWQGWLIDLTADQFGADPITCTVRGDPRYRAVRNRLQIELDLKDVTLSTEALYGALRTSGLPWCEAWH